MRPKATIILTKFGQDRTMGLGGVGFVDRRKKERKKETGGIQ